MDVQTQEQSTVNISLCVGVVKASTHDITKIYPLPQKILDPPLHPMFIM